MTYPAKASKLNWAIDMSNMSNNMRSSGTLHLASKISQSDQELYFCRKPNSDNFWSFPVEKYSKQLKHFRKIKILKVPKLLPLTSKSNFFIQRLKEIVIFMVKFHGEAEKKLSLTALRKNYFSF